MGFVISLFFLSFSSSFLSYSIGFDSIRFDSIPVVFLTFLLFDLQSSKKKTIERRGENVIRVDIPNIRALTSIHSFTTRSVPSHRFMYRQQFYLIELGYYYYIECRSSIETRWLSLSLTAIQLS